jgi:hypothetical protein
MIPSASAPRQPALGLAPSTVGTKKKRRLKPPTLRRRPRGIRLTPTAPHVRDKFFGRCCSQTVSAPQQAPRHNEIIPEHDNHDVDCDRDHHVDRHQ